MMIKKALFTTMFTCMTDVNKPAQNIDNLDLVAVLVPTLNDLQISVRMIRL